MKNAYVLSKNSIVNQKPRCNGCRQHEVRQTVATSLLIDQPSTNAVGMLQSRCIYHVQKRTVIKGQDGGYHYLVFWKATAFIHYPANVHQTWWTFCEFDWNAYVMSGNFTWTIFPPFWISINCWHPLTFGPILTKLDRTFENPNKNASVLS